MGPAVSPRRAASIAARKAPLSSAPAMAAQKSSRQSDPAAPSSPASSGDNAAWPSGPIRQVATPPASKARACRRRAWRASAVPGSPGTGALTAGCRRAGRVTPSS